MTKKVSAIDAETFNAIHRAKRKSSFVNNNQTEGDARLRKQTDPLPIGEGQLSSYGQNLTAEITKVFRKKK